MKGQQTNNLLRQPWTVRCKYVRSSLRKSFLSVFDSRDAKVEKTVLEEPQKGIEDTIKTKTTQESKPITLTHQRTISIFFFV